MREKERWRERRRVRHADNGGGREKERERKGGRKSEREKEGYVESKDYFLSRLRRLNHRKIFLSSISEVSIWFALMAWSRDTERQDRLTQTDLKRWREKTDRHTMKTDSLK